jgi:hypothetical protein
VEDEVEVCEGDRLGERGFEGVHGSSLVGVGDRSGLAACRGGPQVEEQSRSWSEEGAVAALHSDSGRDSVVATLHVWEGFEVTV